MMFSPFRKAKPDSRAPKGKRAYAIGDIHGRHDLLTELLDTIERDIANRPEADTFVVFLGDLIDRGPDSRKVVETLRNLQSDRFRSVFLIGNHEEVLLRLAEGELGLLENWLRFGGAECSKSYGLAPEQLAQLDERTAIARLRSAIPPEHLDFLRSFHDTFRFGDYLFVHAGIRPGIELNSQSQMDLRWIRSAFLESGADHGFIVIHGHTISGAVDEQRNRIGIDTGAYRSGVLTAIGLEDSERWYLHSTAKYSEESPSVD